MSSASGGLGSLLKLLPEIAEADEERGVGLVVHRRVAEILDAERVTLFLFDHRLLELHTPSQGEKHPESLIIRLKMGLAGHCAVLKQPIVVSDANSERFFNRELDAITDFNTERVLVVPVLAQDGRTRGVIQLINKRSGTYGEPDLEAAQALAAEFGGRADLIGRDDLAARAAMDRLIEATHSDRGSLYCYEEARGRLVSVYASGLGETNIRLDLRLGIAGTVAISREPLLIADVSRDPRFDDAHDRRTGFKTRSLIAVALTGARGELIGVIEAVNKRGRAFDGEDLELLTSLARPIALMIEDRALIREQEVQFESLLRVLAASIDAKDSLTAGHSEGVAHYAGAIARELGYGEHDLDVLRVAALLHDYGKIGVEDAVLKKPGKLNEEEYARIQRHATLTRDILDKIKFSRKYSKVPEIAAAHHEMLDGSGYADGLRCGEIPYFAKIIAVADVFEALTADRHYRQAMPVDKALGILQAGAGMKYDAEIVSALSRHLAGGDQDKASAPSIG